MSDLDSARKLVRTVDLELRVDDTDDTAEKIQKLVTDLGGYVSGVDAYLQEGLRHFEIGIKVPLDALDDLLGALRALAVEIQREYLRTEDVTDKYIDLEARLRTLEATEAELQSLLAESRSRGHKAEDIMAVYRHLTEIRTDIERFRGKLNVLLNLTTYSSINVRLVPTDAARPLLAERWRPSETVRSSFRSLVSVFKLLVDGVIFVVIVLLPIGLLTALPVGLLVKAWRSLRRRFAKAPAVKERVEAEE